MILSVDVMGFENNVSEAINGCRVFLKHHKNCEIILVGDEKLIKDLIKPGEKFTIVHTNEFIKQTDNPIAVIRNKNTSMYKAIELAANGKADGVLSAGNTGAYVSLCFLLLKTIEGVNKPAFMPYLPTINKKGLVLLDCGANTQCNGEDLYQFGVMGSLYCKLIRNIKNPKIGVINIGTEDKKGFEYHHKANELFKADKKLNYTGFVETRELLNGEVDVWVADGYTGNIVLKTAEGALKGVSSVIKHGYKKPWNLLGAIFSIGVIKSITSTFNYKNNAGAFVIGLNKSAVKTHGSADAQQFCSALNMLFSVVDKKVVEQIRNNIK